MLACDVTQMGRTGWLVGLGGLSGRVSVCRAGFRPGRLLKSDLDLWVWACLHASLDAHGVSCPIDRVVYSCSDGSGYPDATEPPS